MKQIYYYRKPFFATMLLLGIGFFANVAKAQNVTGYGYTSYTSVNAGTLNYGTIATPFTITYGGSAWETRTFATYTPVNTPMALSNYVPPTSMLELGDYLGGNGGGANPTALFNFSSPLPAGTVFFIQDVDALESFKIEFLDAAGSVLPMSSVGSTYNLSSPARSSSTFNANDLTVTALDGANYGESLSDFIITGTLVKQIRITQIASQANLSSSGTAEFYFAAPPLTTIAGSVFNDPNGGNVNNSTGSANLVPAGMFANLVNSSGNVVATATVNTNGTYNFTNVIPGNYTVVVGTTLGTVGLPAPVETWPSGWANTGDFNGAPDAGNTNTTPNVSSSFAATACSAVSNINFGIQQLPESAVNLQPNTGNPGGFNSLTVTAGAFQTNNVGATPNTQDYDGGTVTNIRITEFPTRANSITIGTTTYTNGGTCPPAATCTPWPVGGVTVPYTNGTGPSVPISVDPVEGNIDVVINFAAIDNAGKEDPTPGSITIPFKTVALSGTVWHDTDGSLTQNGTEAVINGTNTGGGVTTGEVLYANLVDANGKVIATVPVLSDGTYTFPNVPQSATGLTVQLSTNPGTIGLAMPATALSIGWVSTGENVNAANTAIQSGTVGIIELTTSTGNITGQNFGIERLPVSTPKTNPVPYPTGGIIPVGAVTTPVSGTDPEDGTLGNSNTVVITTLPGNATIYYFNGTSSVAVTPGQVILNFNPANISFESITNGSTQVVFQYAFIDAAGQQGTSANYTVSWLIPLPIKIESFTGKANSCNTVLLNWKISDAVNFSHFEIERSKDGSSFQKLATVVFDVSRNSYLYNDNNVMSGNYQYRLKVVDADGKAKYSPVVLVRLDCNQKQILVYPNPVKDKLTIIGLSDNEKVNVYGVNGSLMISRAATRYQEEIDMTNCSAGAYRIVIMNNMGEMIHSATIIKPRQ